MKIMQEETFGPTLPIMRVADEEEAIRLANDTPYGLGASIVTRDGERTEELARRIDAGAVNVNDALINYLALELPMGGHKTSGLGSRHGAGGIRKFTKEQAISVHHAPLRAQARAAHVPVHGEVDAETDEGPEVHVRTRRARLTGARCAGGSQQRPDSAARPWSR